MEKIRLPQDTMTPGQLKQQNGEMEVYSLARPMRWQTLLALPADLRKEYLEKVRDEYKATQIMLAGMLGVSVSTLRKNCRRWGIIFPQTGGYMAQNDRQRWENFLRGDNIPNKIGPGTEKIKEPVKCEPAHLVPRSGSMKFHGPAREALRTMEAALRNTPCSIIISWEVED